MIRLLMMDITLIEKSLIFHLTQTGEWQNLDLPQL